MSENESNTIMTINDDTTNSNDANLSIDTTTQEPIVLKTSESPVKSKAPSKASKKSGNRTNYEDDSSDDGEKDGNDEDKDDIKIIKPTGRTVVGRSTVGGVKGKVSNSSNADSSKTSSGRGEGQDEGTPSDEGGESSSSPSSSPPTKKKQQKRKITTNTTVSVRLSSASHLYHGVMERHSGIVSCSVQLVSNGDVVEGFERNVEGEEVKGKEKEGGRHVVKFDNVEGKEGGLGEEGGGEGRRRRGG